jgi:hypothetical protein
MNKLLLSMTAFAAFAGGVAATPASAAPWQSINQRQANLYNRIEQGVRNGSLTRQEASQLRGRFVALNNLEARYRRGGLTMWERRDLDQRFDALSASIRWQRHDGQDRPWRR